MKLVQMTLDELLPKIAETKKQLQEVFQSAHISHAERWEHYLAWCKLGGGSTRWHWSGWDGKIEGYTGDVIGYDCLVHAERYTTVDLVESMENIIESLVCGYPESEVAKIYDEFEEEEDPYFHVMKRSKTVEILQEALMIDAVSSTYWDW